MAAESSSASPGLPGNIEAPRVSQRAANSCSFCTKRKIKCNKSIPCDNCIKRGHPESCNKLPAIVRGRLVNAPSTTQRSPLTPDQVRLLREGQLQRENVGLRRRVNQLESRIRELEAATPTALDALHGRTGQALSNGESPSDASSPTTRNAFSHLLNAAAASNVASPGEPAPEKSRGDDPDVLEPFVHVMGVPVKSDRPASTRQNSGRIPGRDASEPLSPIPGPGLPDVTRQTTDLTKTDLLTLLPTPPQSMLIIRASLKHIAFVHCAVITAEWIADHDAWITAVSEGKSSNKDDAWLSFYFVLLSVGTYFCGEQLSPDLGITPDEITSLSSFWFDVSLEALNRSKFMSTNPTMDSLRTIIALPAIAYHFGASGYCEMLLHIGLRIAQQLRLHLLSAEPEDHQNLPPGLINRELGRRIWALLRLGEGRPDFANAGTLRLPQGIAAEPFNVNDEDLTDTSVNPRPFTEFTFVTHSIAAERRYRIFRQFNEAFSDATSLKDQYVIAMAADQALQSNFADFPVLHGLDNEVDNLHTPQDFRPHSRYLWGMLNPAGTILVYRSFLGRAYTDSRFAEVRDICIAAAREILRQRRRRVPTMFKKTWPIASYTVLAGVVLATELIHGNPSAEERTRFLQEIHALIECLYECGPQSVVVQRGIPLLRRFLETTANATGGVKSEALASAAVPREATRLAEVAGQSAPSNIGSRTPEVAQNAQNLSNLPAAQDMWPAMPTMSTDAAPGVLDPNLWMGEDLWSSALTALESEANGGWWNTIL